MAEAGGKGNEKHAKQLAQKTLGRSRVGPAENP